MRLLRLPPVLAVAAALAACSANPIASATDERLLTGSGAASASESAADGGIMFGSGHYGDEVNEGQGQAIPRSSASYAGEVNGTQGGILAGSGFESTSEEGEGDGGDGQRGILAGSGN